jgi:hypothetical protein
MAFFLPKKIFALAAFALCVALVVAHIIYMWKGNTSESWDTNNTRRTTNSMSRQ